MKLKCPVCGEVLEVDVDLVEGQRVSCDVCDSSFIFRKEYALVGGRRSRRSPAECQRSKQRNHKKPGCLAQLSLLVFRVVLVVGLIIAAVKMLDVLFSSGVVRQVAEALESKANSPNMTSSKPQTVAAPETRRAESTASSRGLGLIKDTNGIIIGMLGHRLGEFKRTMNESGGTWRMGTLGPRYSSKLPNVISGFDYFELEYDKDNRLCSITLKTWFSSRMNHEAMEMAHGAARRVIEEDYGLSFHVGRQAKDGDGTTFDTYHMILVEGPDGWPTRQIDLCVVPQNSGGYLLYLSLVSNNW